MSDLRACVAVSSPQAITPGVLGGCLLAFAIPDARRNESASRRGRTVAARQSGR